jgi:hypothetical protein
MNGNAGETTQRGIITSRLHEIEDEGEEKNDELLTPTAFPDDLIHTHDLIQTVLPYPHPVRQTPLHPHAK